MGIMREDTQEQMLVMVNKDVKVQEQVCRQEYLQPPRTGSAQDSAVISSVSWFISASFSQTLEVCQQSPR